MGLTGRSTGDSSRVVGAWSAAIINEAGTWKKKGVELDMRAVSDAYYAEIMAAAA
jgi:hypothetical protein